MVSKVSKFSGKTLQGASHFFFILNESEFDEPITRALDAATIFGEKILDKAWVVRCVSEHLPSIKQEVMAKSWNEYIRRILSNERKPYILSICIDFDDFDPNSDDWRIILFGKATSPADTIPTIFGKLVEAFQSGDDPFDWLDHERNELNGLASFGQVVKPGDNFSATQTNQAKSSLDPSWGLISEIVNIANELGLTELDGHRGKLVRAAVGNLTKNKSGFLFGERSVSNALRSKNKWPEIESQVRPNDKA